jgi:hypothetical protein
VADIFISYSKADYDKIVMLSAYLESECWTVWWDRNLGSGEPFRDRIMKELDAARAVIVLWTQHSINSRFVHAEARRAEKAGKLIPVKESDVGIDDIPVPFGELHTLDLSKRERIHDAVAAQLTKPVVQPSVMGRDTDISISNLGVVWHHGGCHYAICQFRGRSETGGMGKVAN